MENIKAEVCMRPQRGDYGAPASLLDVIPCVPHFLAVVCVAIVITPYVPVQYKPHIDMDDKALESVGITAAKTPRCG